MTNTARHTPGPWLPGIKDGNGAPVIAGGVPIAEMIPTHCTKEEFEANCTLVYAAPDMHEALFCPDLEKAHDALSALLEDPDAGNDDIRDAAIDLCDALNTFWEQRNAALATAKGSAPVVTPTCAERAQRAENAVLAYARAKEGRDYDPIAEMASDLFADLCHLFVREGVSPEQMMQRAQLHYEAECAEEGIIL